jgi:hypothetical protein
MGQILRAGEKVPRVILEFPSKIKGLPDKSSDG